jgi:hypothetical protein
MPKKNRYEEPKVNIENEIYDIERYAIFSPGHSGIAKVLREFNKIIKSQQKQIKRLEGLFAVNDAGKTKSSVV